MEECKAAFDEHSHNYKNLVNDSVSFSGLTVDFFAQGKADFFNQLLNEKKEHSVLDIGCGIGELHPYLSQKGRTLTGIDISAESIKVAQNSHKNNIYSVYDGKTLPFADNSFNHVITVCVMHHVPPKQWQDFISEMIRVTKKGGTIAVFEHNPFNPLTRIAVNRCPFDKDAVLLRAKQIETMLSRTEQIKPISSYIFFTPFKHSVFKKLDRLLSWLPLGAQYCTYGQKI